VDLNEQQQACGLIVACLLDRNQWAAQHGAYLLRTNCTEQDPAKVWQKTERVEAHILVCFLSLALWRVLEQWMRGKGLGTSARQLVGEIVTIKSMDVVLPVQTQQG
jgi:transposase